MQTIETKSSAAGSAFEDLHRAFEAFRETNDERLAQLERSAAPAPTCAHRSRPR